MGAITILVLLGSLFSECNQLYRKGCQEWKIPKLQFKSPVSDPTRFVGIDRLPISRILKRIEFCQPAGLGSTRDKRQIHVQTQEGGHVDWLKSWAIWKPILSSYSLSVVGMGVHHASNPPAHEHESFTVNGWNSKMDAEHTVPFFSQANLWLALLVHARSQAWWAPSTHDTDSQPRPEMRQNSIDETALLRPWLLRHTVA